MSTKRPHAPMQFACRYDGCSSRFPHIHNLREHDRMHSRVQPFACRLCDHRTSYQGAIMKHLVRVHYPDTPMGIDGNLSLIQRLGQYVEVDEEALDQEAIELDQWTASAENRRLVQEHSSPSKSMHIVQQKMNVLKQQQQQQVQAARPRFATPVAPVPPRKPTSSSHQSSSPRKPVSSYATTNTSQQRPALTTPTKPTTTTTSTITSSTSTPTKTTSSVSRTTLNSSIRSAESAQTLSVNTDTRPSTGTSVYSCRHCGKTSFSFRDLRQHDRTHSGIRPYGCIATEGCPFTAAQVCLLLTFTCLHI